MARRDDRDADRLRKALHGMVIALRARSPETALEIGEREQTRGYDDWAHRDDGRNGVDSARGDERAPRTPVLSKREQNRRRLFGLARPEIILKPANVVVVYLGEHPTWKSWDWSETELVSRRMLRFVQELDVTDPLPDDPRLAQPLVSAGLTMHRALCVERVNGDDRDQNAVTMDVYEEIARGIVELEHLLDRAFEARSDADKDSEFGADFTHTVMVARTLLLQAVRLGPETWDLIGLCALGLACRYGEPYRITAPNKKAHPACRTAKSRGSQAV